jgi:hypothetical protein
VEGAAGVGRGVGAAVGATRGRVGLAGVTAVEGKAPEQADTSITIATTAPRRPDLGTGACGVHDITATDTGDPSRRMTAPIHPR